VELFGKYNRVDGSQEERNIGVVPNVNRVDLGRLQNAGPGPFSAAGRSLDLHDLRDETQNTAIAKTFFHASNAPVILPPAFVTTSWDSFILHAASLQGIGRIVRLPDAFLQVKQLMF
jgi:hypothetical protein